MRYQFLLRGGTRMFVDSHFQQNKLKHESHEQNFRHFLTKKFIFQPELKTSGSKTDTLRNSFLKSSIKQKVSHQAGVKFFFAE
jgi:hypothetical protein